MNNLAKILLAVVLWAPPLLAKDVVPEDVSIIALIASPEKYDGEVVKIAGYIHLEYEDDALYLHKDDYELQLTKNSIGLIFKHDDNGKILGLDVNRETSNDRYVTVVGTFKKLTGGSENSGELTDIREVEEMLVVRRK